MLPDQLREALLTAGDDQPIRLLASRVCLARPHTPRHIAYRMIVNDAHEQADEEARTVINASAARFASAQESIRLDEAQHAGDGVCMTLRESLSLGVDDSQRESARSG